MRDERKRGRRAGGRGFHRLALLLAFSAASLSAGPLLDSRVRLEPPHPFVGQPFTLCFDVAGEPGGEIEIVSVSGLPGNDHVRFGAIEAGPRRQEKDARGGTIEWHPFRVPAVGGAPLETAVEATVAAKVTRRSRFGFFTSLSTELDTIRLPPLDFVLRSLPPLPDGTPVSTNGLPAVGSFRVKAVAEPSHASVGDLVTITATAEGSGTLNGVSPLLPDFAGAEVRAYPPKVLSRDARHVTLRQVIVPLSTNVAGLGQVTLPYFDARGETFRVARSLPLAIRVTPKAEEPLEVPLRALPESAFLPAPSETATPVQLLPSALADLRRVLPVAAGILALLVAAGMAHAWRPLPRLLLAAAAGAAAGAGMRAWIARARPPETAVFPAPLELRLAPSPQARRVGWIPAGDEVEILETDGGWRRVHSKGQVGWIPDDTPATPDEPSR